MHLPLMPDRACELVILGLIGQARAQGCMHRRLEQSAFNNEARRGVDAAFNALTSSLRVCRVTFACNLFGQLGSQNLQCSLGTIFEPPLARAQPAPAHPVCNHAP